MATSPEHMDELAQVSAPKAGKPPITANPAFPWIVALWFAALLGIGSLIMPVALLERVSTASGLASVLPMAAPPLGFTAQSLVALLGTLAGAVLGFVLAKKIAAPKPAKGAKDNERKVLNAPEDIGDFGIEGDDHDDLPAPPSKNRRRALAIEPEEGPSDFLTVAPLPAVREPKEKPVVEEAPVEEAVAEDPDAEQIDEPRQEFQPVEEPRQMFQPDPVEAEDETMGDEPFELDAEAELDPELTEAQPAQEQELSQPGFERQEFMAVANASGPVVDVRYVEPVEAAATAIEPLAFSPPSMAREHDNQDSGEQHVAAEPIFAPDHDTGPESEDMVSDKQIFEAPESPAFDAPEAAEPDMPVEDTVENAGPEAAEDQGEGLVQLVQRLSSTLDKHREWSAEKAAEEALKAQAEAEASAEAEAEAEAPVPDEFDPAAAEDAAQAMAAWFGTPSATPAVEAEEVGDEETESKVAEAAIEDEPRQRYEAFSGTIAASDFDDEDEDDELADLAASFTLPRIQVSEPEPEPRPAFDRPPVSAEEQAVEVADSGSANPFKRNAEEFVRIDEPEPDAENAEPAVLFPNQETRKAGPPAARAFDRPTSEGEAAMQRAERPKPSNDDNERALREALLNLQRMGK